MKKIRQLHLYLGCIFAPLIIYFSLSGVWQVFRFNDVPKEESPSSVRVLLHELSKPHTHSTAPGASPKERHSVFFDWAAFSMGIGMILTALMGVVLALKFSKNKNIVAACLGLGFLLPILFLFL